MTAGVIATLVVLTGVVADRGAMPGNVQLVGAGEDPHRGGLDLLWLDDVVGSVLAPRPTPAPPTPTSPATSAPATPSSATGRPSSAASSPSTPAAPGSSAPATGPTGRPTGQPTAQPTAQPVGRLSNGCGYSARGIPACGMYVGGAHGANSDPGDREAQVGQRFGVRRTYYRADQVDGAVATARADVAAGRLPWISFKVPYSWAEMASGRGDTWARDLATRLATAGGPVWVAFHHEPEGDGNIADWRRMQEHLAPLVRAAAPNVGFTVVVTGWHQLYGEAQYSLANIWPRGVTVDVAGFDIYQNYGTPDGDGTSTKWTDMAGSYFSRIQPWARQHGVAWAIGETGVTDQAAQADPGVIAEEARLVEKHDGVAFAYFDSSLNSAADWTLSTAAKLRSYAAAVKGAPLLATR